MTLFIQLVFALHYILVNPSYGQSYSQEDTEPLRISGEAEILNSRFESKADERVTAAQLSLNFEKDFSELHQFSGRLMLVDGGSHKHAGGSDQNGAAVVDWAFIDHENLLGAEDEEDRTRLQVGILRIPIGVSNLQPTLHESVNLTPPSIESSLIPYLWRESGLLLERDFSSLRVTAGVFNSLDAEKFNTSESSRGFLVDGVQNGVNAKSRDLMGLLRLEKIFLAGSLGATVLNGNSAQDSQLDKGTFLVWEVHGEWVVESLELSGEYVQARMDESEKITGPTFFSMAEGYHGQIVYSQFEKFPVFVSYTKCDLNAEVQKGGTLDPSVNTSQTRFGINFRPVPEIAYKIQYALVKNDQNFETDLVEAAVSVVF